MSVSLNEMRDYVTEHIGEFHDARLDAMRKLKLKNVLKRKNPYLFRTKNLLTPEEVTRALADAYLSSQEETIFGDWMEKFAIFVNGKAFRGKKSGIPGIDLEFEKEGSRYLVSIKSGPNWGNSRQIAKMRDDFKKAKQTLRTSGNSRQQIVAVNGCCYGKNSKPDKGDYFKLCGQLFWELISGDSDLYLEIVEPLGFQAKRRNDDFHEEYSALVTNFSQEFARIFCHNGRIDWEKIIKFNSEAKKKSNK